MIRKMLLSFVVFATFFTTGALAKSKHMMYQAVPVSKAQILQNGKGRAYCANCGMTLHMFYRTNHAATVKGKEKQYCSMHCLAQDIVNGLHPFGTKKAALKFAKKFGGKIVCKNLGVKHLQAVALYLYFK